MKDRKKTAERIKKKTKNIRRRVEDLNHKSTGENRAIALKYDTKKTKAPKIIATGKGRVAEEILKLAEEHQVPFYEDPDLTELLAKLNLDTEIPPQLFTLVAEVLAVVYHLNRVAKRRREEGVKRRAS